MTALFRLAGFALILTVTAGSAIAENGNKVNHLRITEASVTANLERNPNVLNAVGWDKDKANWQNYVQRATAVHPPLHPSPDKLPTDSPVSQPTRYLLPTPN